MDFTAYLDWSVDDLLKRLALVQSTIADMASLYAEAKSQELDDKARGWNQSMETAVRAREKMSQYNAVAATRTRIETEGKLDALREEKQFLTFLIGVKSKVPEYA